MRPQDFADILARTFDDRRLSRGERQALEQLLAEEGADPQRLAVMRHQVFEHARGVLVDPRDGEVLEWVEQLTKLLTPATEAEVKVEAWFSPGLDCLNAIKRQLRSASRSVDLCVFTITDDRISDEVLAAKRRGVDVHVITDDDKALDRGSDIDRFERAGIPVRVDGRDSHMHHKFALFDRCVLITGSYNWTRSAAAPNYENIVVSDQRSLVAAFARAFDDLWDELS